MDVVLVGYIALSIWGGWRTGFVRRLIGLGFVVLSFVGGAYLRHPLGMIAGTFMKGVPSGYADLVGYAIGFPLILAAAHLVVGPLLSHVAVKGLARATDQALGAVFGALEAILIISAAVVILDTYFGTATTLGQAFGLTQLKQLSSALNGSVTVHILRSTTVPLVLTVLGPLLPRDVSSLSPAGLPTGLPIP